MGEKILRVKKSAILKLSPDLLKFAGKLFRRCKKGTVAIFVTNKKNLVFLLGDPGPSSKDSGEDLWIMKVEKFNPETLTEDLQEYVGNVFLGRDIENFRVFPNPT